VTAHKKCCVSDEMNEMDDEEEVENAGNDH
jgi:hypothetical protein